jgi:hypothetical protein
MNRRFNYTGRTRLAHGAVSLRIVEDTAGGAPRFTADVSNLASLGLPVTASIVIEPYVRQSSMRFEFGSVGAVRIPVDTTLSEIDRGEVPLFRVKVVDTEQRPGRLLAMAAGVQPRDDDDSSERKPILPIKSADLGQQVWKVQVDREQAPMLVINSRIPDLRQRLDEDALLRGAIFPGAIRETLRVMLTAEVDENQEWVEDWNDFAADLTGEALPDGDLTEESLLEAIERVVEAFCEREMWADKARLRAGAPEVDYE